MNSDMMKKRKDFSNLINSVQIVIKKHKWIIYISSIIIILMVIWILYQCFGHNIIQLVYEGRSIDIINRLINNQSGTPIESYFKIADKTFNELFIFLLIISIFFILFNSQQYKKDHFLIKLGAYSNIDYSLPILLIFLVTILSYDIESRYFRSGDSIPAELLPISIINEQNFDFNEFISPKSSMPYWFRHVNNKIISTYPIVPGILNLPTYYFAHIFGFDLFENRYLLSGISAVIISTISIIFMYLCLLRICSTKRTALVFTFIYTFGTCLWSFSSRSMFQHGPSLLFITISLLLIFSRNKKAIPYVGFFLGMAVFNRPTNIMIALPLTIYIYFNHRDTFIRYVLLAGIPLGLLCLYSQIYFGNITSFGQGYAVNYLTGNIFEGLFGILISPSRGLLVFSPIFIFSFYYLFKTLVSTEIDSIYKYLAATVIALVLLYAKWPMWWGGHSFGYRIIIEISPMLIIFLAKSWEKFINNKYYLKIIFIWSTLFSFYVHFIGAFYFPSGFNRYPGDIDQYTERLWDLKDTQISRCTKSFLHIDY